MINFHADYDEATCRELVEITDAVYRVKVENAAKKIAALGKLKYLFLSGPTCSGKTTTAKILTKEFAKHNRSVKLISIDDFYFNRDDLARMSNDKNKIDYDSIKTIDLECFKKAFDDIKQNKTVLLPHFNFETGVRDFYTEYTPRDNEIILCEGIQAVYPEITSLFSKRDYKSIFVNVSNDVKIGKLIFTGREMRLCRRIVRDSKFRAASPYETMRLWDSVVENEEKSILPYSDCDVKIDTTLVYQFGVLRPYLAALMESYPPLGNGKDKPYSDLLEKHRYITPIPADAVPIDSMFREFIGSDGLLDN
ncbi:MAG: hypothetical protein J5922_01030 [Clostridia bacterium]|nr:hypothetical protein [Clostridia bacterium]